MKKKCPGCRKTLPASAFWTNHTRPDGLQYRCKVCLNKIMKRSRVAWQRQTGRRLPAKKECSRCRVLKKADQFHRNNSVPDGLVSRCKACIRELQQERQYLPSRRLAKYKLTREQYNELEQRSGGRCQICRDPFSRTPAIDHCHKTKRVRGLLCSACNTGLGNFRDDPAVLQQALAYLQESALP